MSPGAKPDTDIIVDASGLKCPLPVLLARRALKQHPAIILLTTDPASVLDIPVFCVEAGLQVSQERGATGALLFRIRR